MGYPNEIVRFRRVKNRDLTIGEPGDIILAEDHNELAETLEAVQETLGINPQGQFQTVAEAIQNKLDKIEISGDTEYIGTGEFQRHDDVKTLVNLQKSYFTLVLLVWHCIITEQQENEVYGEMAIMDDNNNIIFSSEIAALGTYGPSIVYTGPVRVNLIPTTYIYAGARMPQGVKYKITKTVIVIYLLV